MGNEGMSAGQLLKQANRLKREEKLDEAIALYHQAIEINPNFAWTYYELGDALAKLGDLDNSVIYLQKSTVLKPNFYLAHQKLVDIFREQGESQQINVIWVASFPKSGNTWVKSVITQALSNKAFVQLEIQGHQSLRKQKKPNIFPLVKPSYSAQPASILKTHYLYEQVLSDNVCLPNIQLSTASFIHIYRNPLDVLLSYINYSRLAYKNIVHSKSSNLSNFKKLLFIDTLGFSEPYNVHEWEEMSLDRIPQKNLDYALDCFSERNLSIPNTVGFSGSWTEHITSWKKAKEEVSGLSLCYENCLENPNEFFSLKKLFDLSETDILEALNLVNSESCNRSHSGDIFYNKMSAYYFFNYFSDSAIARFLKKHENTLNNFGYEFILCKKEKRNKNV